MNKNELINAVAASAEVSKKDAEAVITATLDTITAALKEGEVKLITLEEDAGLVLVVKKNVTADPYYIENLDSESRYIIAGDEYKEDMKKAADKLDTKVNDYAVDRFKVKNIKYPEAAQ